MLNIYFKSKPLPPATSTSDISLLACPVTFNTSRALLLAYLWLKFLQKEVPMAAQCDSTNQLSVCETEVTHRHIHSVGIGGLVSVSVTEIIGEVMNASTLFSSIILQSFKEYVECTLRLSKDEHWSKSQ